MTVDLIPLGFRDPVHDAQSIFRRLLKALSRPGTLVSLASPDHPPTPMAGPLAAIALTLADADCPIWLDKALSTEPIQRYLHFHTNAPQVADPKDATIALVGDVGQLHGLRSFHPGESAYPDRSTTLVVQIAGLTGGPPVHLSGPGIETTEYFAPRGLPDWFWPSWRENAARYPLGIDIFLSDDSSVVGLPRSTKAAGP
ncbi:phosphonate C-P lyase system protein PhnH [Bradyrhizobium brasilense]|uniref:phosphonate C-P lyase system protein PhnH n=1 Tax=Bradyrhizobium brasilense TaxID=1419277 RepID=UPI002877F596|nr:phosphonate C-P lyase system protein PhnH [Bradyrhizobium brasilense]MCP3418657.1 phosphonate C-P lyase system protein PhnH [Bradyrhizobium brasilense]